MSTDIANFAKISNILKLHLYKKILLKFNKIFFTHKEYKKYIHQISNKYNKNFCDIKNT